MNWRTDSCNNCPVKEEVRRKYQLVVMDAEGKTTLGRTYYSFEEVHDAMIELRILYAKHEVSHHVGYMEVR